MAGGGISSTSGNQSSQAPNTWSAYGIPQPIRSTKTAPTAPAVSNPGQPVLYGNPAQATSNVPSYAQDALANMSQQLRGLQPAGQQAQSMPMQPQWAQQQPSWMPQFQQAQQSFQQSDAFKNYQAKMQELQNQFQSSPEYQQFNQQQESFRPQMQEWQQQQMQRPFRPMYGGFQGRGHGMYGEFSGGSQGDYDDRGETPGFGKPSGVGGLAGLMGGFGFYR